MINSTNTVNSATTTASDYMKQTTGLNKDDFMKLFVTQLQNQDPLAPQDSSAMVAQMAQLTQVEQSYNTNTNLKNLLDAMGTSSNMSAVSFIGKSVIAQGNEVKLTSGTQPQLNFNLPTNAEKLLVSIQDAGGYTVRTMELGRTKSGNISVAWDGKDNKSTALPDGIYNLSVSGVALDGSTVTGTPYIKALIDGVKLSQGTAVLSANGIDVPMANVTSISN